MNGRNLPQQGMQLTGMQLHDAEGRRLYFTEAERRAFLAAAAKAPREVRTFCGVLHATGCRVSEALALTAERVDLARKPASYAAQFVTRCRCFGMRWRRSWLTLNGMAGGPLRRGLAPTPAYPKAPDRAIHATR